MSVVEQNTLLRTIPAMTKFLYSMRHFISKYIYMYFPTFYSGILSGIYSDILSDMGTAGPQPRAPLGACSAH